MSLFDFPRINFQGTLQLNPGTANNDDYAQGTTLPESYGPYAGSPLGLIDSKTVEPRTYGMSDADFIAWVQKQHQFNPTTQKPIIPAEWNYYGDMSSQNLVITVAGAQTGVGTGPGSLADLVGATLTFNGVITDVNSEGSPPSTQFFFDTIKLAAGTKTFLQATPNKGACQWLNFYRNVNLTADAGAGGYVYHVIRKGPGTTIDIPGFEAPNVVGVIFRYYLYRPISKGGNEVIEKIYENKGTNPATLQIAGTFAPLYSDETIFTGPVGRLLTFATTNINTPTKNNNGGDKIALAPAVLRQDGNKISADFIGTFPENNNGNTTAPDPKFNFGAVTLVASAGTQTAAIGPVDYTNVPTGNASGWIFDFDISSNPAAQQVLANPDAVFSLQSAEYGPVLTETNHYFVSNQQGIYAEQFGTGALFRNQGTEEPATVRVFRYGKELPASVCPPITVWQYRSVPLQAPGNREAIATGLRPGDPIHVDTVQPGNFLFTFSIDTSEEPPVSYNDFMNPPYITNYPAISLRILPNYVNFDQYYVDPAAPEPIGNASLTFDIVYTHALRTYYLLYPVMNMVFPLNDEAQVAAKAGGILARTELSIWMNSGYMPRTRDMSQSRRTLLRAWCRKVLAGKAKAK